MKTEHVIIGRRCILHYSDLSLKRVVLEPVLAGEEMLLEQAEDIMELRYPEKADVFIQIAPLYLSYADLNGVHYLAPYEEFLRISEGGSPGMPHEWAHFLALKLLCPARSVKPPAFFLTEGLATAVDALANRKYGVHVHLVAKGLSELGKLKPIATISPKDFLSYTQTIYNAGSFTLYLVEQFHIRRLKDLYCHIGDGQNFKHYFKQIYGKSLSHIQKDWLSFLKLFFPTELQRAKYVAVASLKLDRLHSEFLEYEKALLRSRMKLPLNISEKERELRHAYFALLEDPNPRYAYTNFLGMLATFHDSIRERMRYLRILCKARMLIGRDKNYRAALKLLERSFSSAVDCGDVHAASKIRYYIDVVRFLEKAKRAREYEEKNKFLQLAERRIKSVG